MPGVLYNSFFYPFAVGIPFDGNRRRKHVQLLVFLPPFMLGYMTMVSLRAGLIKLVTKHHAQMIYTRTTAVEDEETK